MVDRLFFDNAYITNLIDGAKIDVYLSSNKPSLQIYNPNSNGGYDPDWRMSNMVITPKIFINNMEVNPGGNPDVRVSWSKKYRDDEIALDSYE